MLVRLDSVRGVYTIAVGELEGWARVVSRVEDGAPEEGQEAEMVATALVASFPLQQRQQMVRRWLSIKRHAPSDSDH